MAHSNLANPHSFDKLDMDIVKLLKDNPEGLRVNIILKRLNLRNRTLYNHLNKLKKEGLIENIYPIWKYAMNQNAYLNMANSINQKSIQSHKFSFILKLVQKPLYWDKHENRALVLNSLGTTKVVKWGNSKYDKLTLKQFIVHFFPDTILFINQKKYYSHDPYLALQKALEDTLGCLEHIETSLKFKFYNDNIPQFKIRSNHYVKLKDEIANRFKDKNMPLQVEIDGKIRAWVDFSEPFGLETGDKDHGVEDMSRYKDFVTDIMKNNPPTNTQLSNVITNQNNSIIIITELMKKTDKLMSEYDNVTKELLNVQIGFKDNIVLHMDVLNSMKTTMNNIDKGINFLVNHHTKDKVERSLFKSMEKNYNNKLRGNQTVLNKYFK